MLIRNRWIDTYFTEYLFIPSEIKIKKQKKCQIRRCLDSYKSTLTFSSSTFFYLCFPSSHYLSHISLHFFFHHTCQSNFFFPSFFFHHITYHIVNLFFFLSVLFNLLESHPKMGLNDLSIFPNLFSFCSWSDSPLTC